MAKNIAFIKQLDEMSKGGDVIIQQPTTSWHKTILIISEKSNKINLAQKLMQLL